MESNRQHSEQQVVEPPQYVADSFETHEPPPSYRSLPNFPSTLEKLNSKWQNKQAGNRDVDISCSFKGYEDGMRKRLEVDNKIQPTISLWV